MTSWLSKQRKQTLLDLSAQAGLQQDDESQKKDLVENLDKHLQKNATRLSRDSHFEPYFGTRRTPSKPRASSAAGAGVTSDDGEVKSTVKARGRRTTKVKQEADDEEDAAESASQAVVPKSTAVTARTPGRPRRRSELPPSPADVADDIEYAATRMYASVNDLYTVSGISERLDQLRDLCSSVTGVQMTFLILEGLALQQQLLPWKTAMMIPSFHLLGMEIPDILLPLPDLFALVTSDFWYPATLWATTSIFIPLLFAYFFNLTTRDVKRHGAHVTVMRYRADPLTFNVVKALMTWIVYQSQYTLFGLFDPDVALSINHAMFGGHRQMLVGSCIGMLAALYEAAQRK